MLGTDYDQNFSGTTLGYHSTNYFYPAKFTETNLQIGQSSF